MKDLLIRGLDKDIHHKLEVVAKKRNISKSDLVTQIIKRAFVEDDLISTERIITNHLNEHNNTVNRLIDVNAEVVKEINNLSEVIKHYMR